MNRKSPSISFSIADIPLNISHSTLFHFAKQAGFDGVEVLPGIKSLSTIDTFSSLSQRYDIPILSVHAPLSFGKLVIGMKKTYDVAKYFKALIVLHPIKNLSLTDPRQIKYLTEHAKLANEYTVPVTLENVSNRSSLPLYKYFSVSHHSVTCLNDIVKISKKFNFGVTLDTCHLQTPDLQNVDGFETTYESIKNIHLSDYTPTKQHLALGSGKLNVEKFMNYLKSKNYRGLITLEFSPRMYYSPTNYFSELKSSLNLVRKYF